MEQRGCPYWKVLFSLATLLAFFPASPAGANKVGVLLRRPSAAALNPTRWQIEKTATPSNLVDPDGSPIQYTVTVTELSTGPQVLEISGTLKVKNRLKNSTFLSNVVFEVARKIGRRQYETLARVVDNLFGASQVDTCFGPFANFNAESLTLLDPVNNDVLAFSQLFEIPSHTLLQFTFKAGFVIPPEELEVLRSARLFAYVSFKDLAKDPLGTTKGSN